MNFTTLITANEGADEGTGEGARITDADAIAKFVTGGNAVFTLVSVKSGKRFTYRVKDAEEGRFFVSVMTGPDNSNDFTYAGMFARGEFYSTKASKVASDAPSVAAFKWLAACVDADSLSSVEFWHVGKCCACGRRLTDPESIRTGFGPVCRARI